MHVKKTSCDLPLIFLHHKLTEIKTPKTDQYNATVTLDGLKQTTLNIEITNNSFQFLQTKLHAGDQILNCIQKEIKTNFVLNFGHLF